MTVVPHRIRLATVLVGLIALAGALGVQSSRAAAPSLTLSVNVNGSLEAVLGNGTRIRTSSAPGVVIPPGTYLVIVNSDVPDDRDIFHLFHLTGPGMNMSSDLLPCENPRELQEVTLRPSSTYTYEDTPSPGAHSRGVQHVRRRVELPRRAARRGVARPRRPPDPCRTPR